MSCLLMNTQIFHILYSVDYPFAQNEWGLKWFQDLEASKMVSPADLEKIASKNAEALLRVRLPEGVSFPS